MGPTTMDSNARLSELLHSRALATAPRRLLLDLAGGTVVTAAALWLRPKGWMALVSAGLCFALYGLWAFSERYLAADDWTSSARVRLGMRIVHMAASGMGLVALVSLLFSLLGLTLGTWIS
ncbi:MAG: hypothetical protein IPP90_09895 [Gemmatimonadaceae bacterium]|nr:hypothetical protein [Gemmatimonadaceae bacterium]